MIEGAYLLEQYDAALMAWDLVLRLNPRNVTAHNNKGMALVGLKRYADALACFEQALRLDSRCALAYSNRGRTLYALGQHEEAVKLCDFAYQLDARYRSARKAYAEIVQNASDEPVQTAALLESDAAEQLAFQDTFFYNSCIHVQLLKI
jgi:tetratricopeptide (TPR) repeat protein